MRAGLPVLGHAQPRAGPRRSGRSGRRAPRCRCAGLRSAWVSIMPRIKVLALAAGGGAPRLGRSASIRGATPEASMMASSAAQRDVHRCPPSSAIASASAGLQGGGEVAEPLAAGDPGGVHERGQAEALRDLGQPGRPQPAGIQPGSPVPPASARASGGSRSGGPGCPAAGDQVAPGGRRGGQQPLLVAGQHRHGPRPPPAPPRPRRPTGGIMSVPRTCRRSARISPAPAPRQTSPVARIRRAAVGWVSPARDNRRSPPGIGCLGPLPGQRCVRWHQRRAHARGPGTAGWCAASAASRRAARVACAANRSITDGCSSTAATGSMPSLSPGSASFPAAHSRFFARSRPPGPAVVTTARAKHAAGGGHRRGPPPLGYTPQSPQDPYRIYTVWNA